MIRPHSLEQQELEFPRPLIRSHSLEHPELEFPGPSQGDGLAASPGFINAIGGLSPMVSCGRTSLWSPRQGFNFSAASAGVRNQQAFRHSARQRLLKASMIALSVTLASWRSCTPSHHPDRSGRPKDADQGDCRYAGSLRLPTDHYAAQTPSMVGQRQGNVLAHVSEAEHEDPGTTGVGKLEPLSSNLC